LIVEPANARDEAATGMMRDKIAHGLGPAFPAQVLRPSG